MIFDRRKILFCKSVSFWGSLVGLSATLFLMGAHARNSNDKKEASAIPAPQNEISFPAGLVSLSTDPRLATTYFVVDKSKRVLKVYRREGDLPQLIEEHPTDIGKGVGDKVRENDHRTPVGIYFLQKKMSPPEIPFDLYGSLAFATDYPNIFDKRQEKTGNGIWLHAIPDSVPLTRGSRGCVVVRDQVIQKIASFVELKHTPLVIADSLAEIPKDGYLTEKGRLLDLFEKWRVAWEKSDVDTYIQFYDASFKNAQMDYQHWYEHKKKLKGLYKFIKVELSSPVILRNKNQVVIRTIQTYQSDLHQDIGEKTIHAFDDPKTGFKIIREDWRPLSKQLLRLTSELDAQKREAASVNSPSPQNIN